MANRSELLRQLGGADPEEPFDIDIRDLDKINADDIPTGLSLHPVRKRGPDTFIEEDYDIELYRGDSGLIEADIAIQLQPKYWHGALGVHDYLELVRLTVGARSQSLKDVREIQVLDDENEIGVIVGTAVGESNVAAAYQSAKRIKGDLLEPAEAALTAAEDLKETAAKRIQGWGTDELRVLVDRMRDGSAYEKGLRLEELTSRLFMSIPGFMAYGRVSTETEEIDVHVLNSSDDPVWRRETALLIAECKNWTGSVGKDELVLFRTKLDNRTGRVSLGFLISWNGFADTVTAELLRGSRGSHLIVLISGEDLREGVRNGDFGVRLRKLYTAAVMK